MKKFVVVFSLVAILATGFIACSEEAWMSALEGTKALQDCTYLRNSVKEIIDDLDDGTIEYNKAAITITGTIEKSPKIDIDATVKLTEYNYSGTSSASGKFTYKFKGNSYTDGTLNLKSIGKLDVNSGDTNYKLGFDMKFVFGTDDEGADEITPSGTLTYNGNEYDYEDTLVGWFD